MLCGSSDMGDRCRKGLVALNGKRHAKRIRGKGLGREEGGGTRLGALVARKRRCGTRQPDAADWCEAGGYKSNRSANG